VEAKWALITAFASGVLPNFEPDGEVNPLHKIQREGTCSFIRNMLNAGIDMATIFITLLNRENTADSMMWHPGSLYIEEEDESEDETLPDVVSGDPIDEHRIKSWFQRKTYNGFQSVMVHLKRKPRVSTRASTAEMYINFQLKDVPDVIRRLTTYCIVNGIGNELLSTLTYLQTRIGPTSRQRPPGQPPARRPRRS
jgi:hypothetical protein